MKQPLLILSLQEVSSAVISQWKKESLRSKLKALKDAVHEADKAVKAQLILSVCDYIVSVVIFIYISISGCRAC